MNVTPENSGTALASPKTEPLSVKESVAQTLNGTQARVPTPAEVALAGDACDIILSDVKRIGGLRNSFWDLRVRCGLVPVVDQDGAPVLDEEGEQEQSVLDITAGNGRFVMAWNGGLHDACNKLGPGDDKKVPKTMRDIARRVNDGKQMSSETIHNAFEATLDSLVRLRDGTEAYYKFQQEKEGAGEKHVAEGYLNPSHVRYADWQANDPRMIGLAKDQRYGMVRFNKDVKEATAACEDHAKKLDFIAKEKAKAEAAAQAASGEAIAPKEPASGTPSKDGKGNTPRIVSPVILKTLSSFNDLVAFMSEKLSEGVVTGAINEAMRLLRDAYTRMETEKSKLVQGYTPKQPEAAPAADSDAATETEATAADLPEVPDDAEMDEKDEENMEDVGPAEDTGTEG